MAGLRSSVVCWAEAVPEKVPLESGAEQDVVESETSEALLTVADPVEASA